MSGIIDVYNFKIDKGNRTQKLAGFKKRLFDF